MDTIKHITLEKKDNHKLLTFLAVLVAFIVVTFILYILAQKDKSTFYAPMIAFAFPILAIIGANYMVEKFDEKKRSNQDSWAGSEEDFKKIKKSRFSKFRNNDLELVSHFGLILSIISAYLSIYLSEVLSLTKNLKKQFPNDTFSSIFMDVFKDILKFDWARKYLVEYWIWVTIFIAIIVGAAIWGTRKKMKIKEEIDTSNKSKFNKKY